MKIAEIFSSIQGEGNFLGVAATFVRTMGCNLKCSFCDTKITWGNNPAAMDMSIEDIIKKVETYNNSLVVITGGEPCMQTDIQELIDGLMLKGYFVTMETNGTQPTPTHIDWITCSPKEDADYNINILCRANELKYVVTPEFDADKAIPKEIRELFAGKIWLQPEGSMMKEMWKKCFDIAMSDPRLRVGIQLHKIMEVE